MAESGQGEKTSSGEVREREKYINVKVTTDAILVHVFNVSTIWGQCSLALAM